MGESEENRNCTVSIGIPLWDETTLPDERASNESKDIGDKNKSNKPFENSSASNHSPVKIEPALKIFKAMLDVEPFVIHIHSRVNIHSIAYSKPHSLDSLAGYGRSVSHTTIWTLNFPL